jgi:hypothetical protein
VKDKNMVEQSTTSLPKKIISRIKVWFKAVLGLIILYCGVQTYLFVSGAWWGFQPKEMALAQYTPKDVVGDLGGMPVTIPRHMAEFVEYNGDPGWGEKRQGPIPERTHASKLKSFGIDFRYLDMATLSSPEMRQDKQSKTIYNTDWMGLGVSAGTEYYGDGGLDRIARETVEGTGQYFWNKFAKLPEQQFGMDVYVLTEINPNTGQPARFEDDGNDVFVARNKKGKIIAYIECSNVPHAAAPCSQYFSMEYDGVHAKVYISYRRGHLKDWQDIQAKVTAMLLGFRVIPPAKETEKSNP